MICLMLYSIYVCTHVRCHAWPIQWLLHVRRYVCNSVYLDGFPVKKSIVCLNKEYLCISRGQHKLQNTISIQIILEKPTEYQYHLCTYTLQVQCSKNTCKRTYNMMALILTKVANDLLFITKWTISSWIHCQISPSLSLQLSQEYNIHHSIPI